MCDDAHLMPALPFRFPSDSCLCGAVPLLICIKSRSHDTNFLLVFYMISVRSDLLALGITFMSKFIGKLLYRLVRTKNGTTSPVIDDVVRTLDAIKFRCQIDITVGLDLRSFCSNKVTDTGTIDSM